MPAAPAGRAVLPRAARADPPARNATRRGFMLGSSALLASLLIPRAPPRPRRRPSRRRGTTPPTGRSPTACRTSSTATGTAHAYTPKRAMFNANLLLTHAAAALAGHTGSGAPRRPGARADHGAVRGPGVGHASPATARQGHKPGWQDGLTGGGIQHLVVDTEIAWPLMFAWQAREALGLDEATADLIADRIIRTVNGSSGSGRRCG